MLLAIISDTHLPRGIRALPETCVARLRAADLILHAGDVMDGATLDMVESLGPPLVAVHGNVDRPDVVARLPARRTVDVGGVCIGMVHDAGPAIGRLERQRAAFPDCAAVVFGHSHIPLHERSPDEAFQLFNPGSPTDRRRQPRHTMGMATIADGAITFSHVTLD
jgi:putative phosphoesterase